jgi:hypothetical protein
MFHLRFAIDEVMRVNILPPSWKLVLMSIGSEAQLEEEKGFLTSIDQNGTKNCTGENVD